MRNRDFLNTERLDDYGAINMPSAEKVKNKTEEEAKKAAKEAEKVGEKAAVETKKVAVGAKKAGEKLAEETKKAAKKVKEKI